jgi:hypothetical protein
MEFHNNELAIAEFQRLEDQGRGEQNQSLSQAHRDVKQQ